MGRLARVLSYIYSSINGDNVASVKSSLGGGANTTAQHAEPANQTSRPLPQDLVVMVPVPGEGKEVAVAFIDPFNPQGLLAGEHMTYAREESGEVVCSVHLKADGALSISSNSSVNINGVIIDANGNITAPAGSAITAPIVEGTASLLGAGVEHVGHLHGGVTAGAASTAPIV